MRKFLPRRVKPRRILAGPLAGRRLVTSWHDYPAALLGYTERSLLRWLKANVRLGETWLDVGAHYGYTTLALCELVGPQGRVFAFEPVLETAGHLATTRSVNRLRQLTVIPLGLSSAEHPVPLRVPRLRGMAHHVGAATIVDTIFIVALDTLWPELAGGDGRLDGVKLDVQGMEYEALLGMRATLASAKPRVVVEFHHGVERKPVLGLLQELGYALPALRVASGTPGPPYLDDESYLFSPLQWLSPNRILEPQRPASG